MRCLIFNTEEIEFAIGEPANRPEGVANILTDVDDLRYERVTLVLLCVEKSDSKRDASIVSSEIERYYDNHKFTILLVPFAHLSSNIETSSELALERIRSVSDTLRNKGIPEAGALSFGYDTAFVARWITILHKGNVAFRDSRANVE